jgi:hypothetical protein
MRNLVNILQLLAVSGLLTACETENETGLTTKVESNSSGFEVIAGEWEALYAVYYSKE